MQLRLGDGRQLAGPWQDIYSRLGWRRPLNEVGAGDSDIYQPHGADGGKVVEVQGSRSSSQIGLRGEEDLRAVPSLAHDSRLSHVVCWLYGTPR